MLSMLFVRWEKAYTPLNIIIRPIALSGKAAQHKVRIVFKGNVTDKSIKTHAKRANLNVHRCKIEDT